MGGLNVRPKNINFISWVMGSQGSTSDYESDITKTLLLHN